MKLSKRTLLSLVMIAGLGTVSAAHAYQDCDAKRAALENQIRIAEQYGNYNKVMGLKKALAEVNAHCTNGSVVKDAEKKVQKLEDKVADQKADIREVQADLNTAKAKGDAKKVAKYQSKLAEKQADLKKLQAELKAAKAELAALKK